MTWHRAKFAHALADMLAAAVTEGGPSVFASPPLTLNAPAVVVGRPSEVVYGSAGLGVDVATVPVVCIGALEGEDAVDGLIAFVRSTLSADPSISHTVQIASAPNERNWRAIRVGGADLLAADVTLTVQM